jgi:hypothetical protein
VDAKLADSVADRLNIAGVAEGESIEARGDVGAGAIVLQPGAPSAESLRLP